MYTSVTGLREMDGFIAIIVALLDAIQFRFTTRGFPRDFNNHASLVNKMGGFTARES